MQKHVSVLPHSQFRCTQRPTPTHTFFRFSFQTHPDAMHTLSTIMVQGRVVKNHSIKVVLADLPYLSATETTSTTWTSCNPLAHILLRVGRNDMPDTNTGYEPDSELDMAGRFVPVVDLTHDDEDKYSHMSNIPLQLPASANVPSNNQASVTLSFMRNVPSPPPDTSQTGVNLGNCSIPVHTLRVHWQFLKFKKLFSWLHNEHEQL